MHPECKPEVTALADFVDSTAAIMNFAKQSPEKEFIIGTEISITEHLAYSRTDKFFHPLSKDLICPNMKLTTLADVYRAVSGISGEEITLDAQTIEKARICMERMIELG